MTHTPNAKRPSREAAQLRTAKPGSPGATELNDADLDRVSGGETTTQPRDPASGLPTGKRL